MSSLPLIAEPPGAAAEQASLYDRDGYAWARQQAEALRRRNLEAIDWDNVIEEIETVGRAEKRPWVDACGKAIERMLLVEHYRTATEADIRGWEREIGYLRIDMAGAVDSNPSLRAEYDEMLSLAWDVGRWAAVRSLAKHTSGEAGALSGQVAEQAVEMCLPADCPYLAEHVAAYDPEVDKDPSDDDLPPGVAEVFNRVLGRDYPILAGPRPQRGRER